MTAFNACFLLFLAALSVVKVAAQSIDASTAAEWYTLTGSEFCEVTCKTWKSTGAPFETGKNTLAGYQGSLYLCYTPDFGDYWAGWNGEQRMAATGSGSCWSPYSAQNTTYTTSPTCLCVDSSFPVVPVYLSPPQNGSACASACTPKQVSVQGTSYIAAYEPIALKSKYVCAENATGNGFRAGWVDNSSGSPQCLTSNGYPSIDVNPQYACACKLSSYQRSSTGNEGGKSSDGSQGVGGLSTGAVAGIASGAAIFVVAMLVFAFVLVRRRRARK
ncbi:hypothetical protein BJ742DRAFT_810057 [Cladochytrium replicatum]|nr:hypothetical protein BJ742DRAFT_810057 [Cladochytrium replicatum]